ncbi:3178_t:CDS:1 [Paraglomus brasilianum]|uniref:3178_t:CDS:1 n=1 Tax=Paraglomus brasilianum TaxID=144538 RepID=A0A9N9BNZ0_9GLOM|nr:3178_t:CDS:1 [Paraglomus brasilianum]
MPARLTFFWRSLRLPWRTRVYVGSDLSGNTYYESLTRFHDRTRRTVDLNRPIPVAEYREHDLPVQWQSWLKHTRFDPPTLQELEEDERRKRVMKEKVKLLESQYADEKRKRLENAEERQVDKSRDGKEVARQESLAEKLSKKPIPSDDFRPEEWIPDSDKKQA